jgi:hypothetical protein
MVLSLALICQVNFVIFARHEHLGEVEEQYG